jgi:ATP-dependent RNA helicase DbpA
MRIGRTARAGAQGLALSLIAPADKRRVESFEAALSRRFEWHELPGTKAAPLQALFQTLVVDAGRQDKLRPGDLLGALTAGAGLAAADIGKIDVFPTRSYVAIKKPRFSAAFNQLKTGKIKGRSFRIRKIL